MDSFFKRSVGITKICPVGWLCIVES